MSTNQKHVDKSFYLQWVLANTIGFCVGSIAGFIMPIFANLTNPVAFGILFSTVFGAVGGLAQWLVLRRWVSGINLWAPASALGSVIAAGIVASMGQRVFSNFNVFVLFAAVYGATGGFLQWLILRKQGVNIVWWLAANLVGSLLGSALNYPASAALQRGPGNPTDVFFMILFGLGAGFGLGLGVVTGSVLTWLLRHPKPGPQLAAATRDAR